MSIARSWQRGVALIFAMALAVFGLVVPNSLPSAFAVEGNPSQSTESNLPELDQRAQITIRDGGDGNRTDSAPLVGPSETKPGGVELFKVRMKVPGGGFTWTAGYCLNADLAGPSNGFYKTPGPRQTTSGAFASYGISNPQQVQWILENGYAGANNAVHYNTARTQLLLNKAGVRQGSISHKDLIHATQLAIWRYTNGYTVQSSWWYYHSEMKKVYDYLVSNASSGTKLPDYGVSITPSVQQGNPGQKIGPFTVKTTGGNATLTMSAPSGVTLVDEYGNNAHNTQVNGAKNVYVLVPAGQTPGSATLTLSGKGELPTGSFLSGSDKSRQPIGTVNPGGVVSQTVNAIAIWNEKPETSTSVTTTTETSTSVTTTTVTEPTTTTETKTAPPTTVTETKTVTPEPTTKTVTPEPTTTTVTEPTTSTSVVTVTETPEPTTKTVTPEPTTKTVTETSTVPPTTTTVTEPTKTTTTTTKTVTPTATTVTGTPVTETKTVTATPETTTVVVPPSTATVTATPSTQTSTTATTATTTETQPPTTTTVTVTPVTTTVIVPPATTTVTVPPTTTVVTGTPVTETETITESTTPSTTETTPTETTPSTTETTPTVTTSTTPTVTESTTPTVTESTTPTVTTTTRIPAPTPVKVRTIAVDQADNDKTVVPGGTIVDRVMIQGLTEGQTYTVVGELMDKETGKSIGSKASKTFVADGKNVTVQVTFTLPANVQGKKLVVFEKLYAGVNVEATPIASHEDINDEAQTITVEEVEDKGENPGGSSGALGSTGGNNNGGNNNGGSAGVINSGSSGNANGEGNGNGGSLGGLTSGSSGNANGDVNGEGNGNGGSLGGLTSGSSGNANGGANGEGNGNGGSLGGLTSGSSGQADGGANGAAGSLASLTGGGSSWMWLALIPVIAILGFGGVAAASASGHGHFGINFFANSFMRGFGVIR